MSDLDSGEDISGNTMAGDNFDETVRGDFLDKVPVEEVEDQRGKRLRRSSRRGKSESSYSFAVESHDGAPMQDDDKDLEEQNGAEDGANLIKHEGETESEHEEKQEVAKKKGKSTPRKSKRGKGKKRQPPPELESPVFLEKEENVTIQEQLDTHDNDDVTDDYFANAYDECKEQGVGVRYDDDDDQDDVGLIKENIHDAEPLPAPEPLPPAPAAAEEDEQQEQDSVDGMELGEIPTSPEPVREIVDDKSSTLDTIEEGEVNDSLEHHDTEMVSEDELPSDGPKVPLDTEAVSDEELPCPTQAELLDTEAVSEDELPPVKRKRKHRRHSSETEKRQKSDKDKDSSKRSRDSKSPLSKKDKDAKASAKLKSLPELDKYWKAVKEDPSDFTGWTYLLQYVDQENDIEAAREAYDKFLSHYPYCYGYWRKFADYEKRKGGDSSKCDEVFERGLNAIPLSVDLWLHYLNFCKASMKEDEDKLRSQFERALEQCGLEFKSDRLWDCYIKWEIECKNHQNAYAIYNRLLATPTQGYKTHFESFEDFIRSHHPNKILGVDEFLELRVEVVQKIKEKGLPMEPSAAPPGDESDGDEETSSAHADEEIALMREKLISIGKKLFKETISEVLTRWNFEDGIKRPYFHVKPLERCQLNTWREYLEYEIGVGSEKRTTVLFERCLIACALYEEFWVKYIKYLEGLPGDREEEIRKVYHRACTIHHPKKPYLSLNWASFEECKGNFEGARKVLLQIEKEVPSMMLVHLRRINLERRAQNYEEAGKLYESYIANTKSRSVFVTLSVKYSRFCWKVWNDPGKGVEVLRKAIEKNPDDMRLYVQLLDLLMIQSNMNEGACVAVFDKIIERESVDIEDKIIFAQRRIEFLEDFGSDIKSVQKAQTEYFGILKQLKESRRHSKDEKSKSEDAKKVKDGQTAPGAQSNSYSSSTYSNPPTSYSSTYQGSGQYSQPTTYGQPSQNSSSQYSSQTDQNSSSYQNWNYSQSNYGNGNQSWGGYNYYS